MTEVKSEPTRTRGRQAEKSRQTRRRIVLAAAELFVERGYGATALQDVADRAEVAVQTIYFTFRNKRTLLKEVVDVTVAGDDEPVATMERPWFTGAMATAGADAHLRAHVDGSGEVVERVAAIIDVLRTAAAADPELAELWRQGNDARYAVQSAAARSLTAKPGAAPGLAPQAAADLLYSLLSPELYLVFVRERGWAPQRWRGWVYQTLRAQLIAG